MIRDCARRSGLYLHWRFWPRRRWPFGCRHHRCTDSKNLATSRGPGTRGSGKNSATSGGTRDSVIAYFWWSSCACWSSRLYHWVPWDAKNPSCIWPFIASPSAYWAFVTQSYVHVIYDTPMWVLSVVCPTCMMKRVSASQANTIFSM